MYVHMLTHACLNTAFEFENGSCTVEDLESSNGTVIDGTRLKRHPCLSIYTVPPMHTYRAYKCIPCI